MIKLNENFAIKIKTINSNIYDLEVNREYTVEKLKQLIESKLRLRSGCVRLIFRGKVMEDKHKLHEYKLEENDVVHLVEQRPNYERSHTYSESRDPVNPIDSLDGYLNMLMAATRQMLASLGDDEVGISNSFKSLTKRSSFNRNELIETMRQNFNNINSIISNTVKFDAPDNSKVEELFIINNSKCKQISFKVGQWIDAKDNTNTWLEAQIIAIRDNKAQINYLGWGNVYNEWIDLNSPRLALFRTQTIQSPFSKYISPFPNKKSEDAIAFKDVHSFDDFGELEELVNFIDNLRNKIMKVVTEKDTLLGKKRRACDKDITKEEILIRERNVLMNIMQMYPLMDRIGRVMVDYSNYFFNYSFNYFENNLDMFNSRNDFTDLSRENSENVNKRNVKSFQEYTKVRRFCNFRSL